MSVSTTPTRLPLMASNVARLAVRLDLPVPPRYEWTEMILAILPHPPLRERSAPANGYRPKRLVTPLLGPRADRRGLPRDCLPHYLDIHDRDRTVSTSGYELSRTT